jgi:DNA polymerase/3'-5' exonuclease PolX
MKNIKISNNENIIEQFKLLQKQIQYDIDFSSKNVDSKQKTINMFRLRSVAKVIKQLEKYIKENNNKEIKSSSDLKNIEGIGKNSLIRIDEILKTGKLSEVKITQETEKYLKFINELEEVIGIGRKKAYDLFKNYNIKSIDELKEKHKKGEIELPNNIIKGLSYVDKIKENIPREHIEELEEILLNTTLEISPKLYGIICGSYRRMKQTSNDIDIIIVHSDMRTKKDIETSKINYLELFIKKLKEKKIIVDSLTSESVPTKYMGICNLKNVLRRIDIRYIAHESYYPAILYFTGSKELNTKMRNIALTMDYTLNEYGLFDENNKLIHVNSEEEIFEHLGMEYLSPEKR